MEVKRRRLSRWRGRLNYGIVNDQGLVDMNSNEIIESASGTWDVRG